MTDQASDDLATLDRAAAGLRRALKLLGATEPTKGEDDDAS